MKMKSNSVIRCHIVGCSRPAVCELLMVDAAYHPICKKHSTRSLASWRRLSPNDSVDLGDILHRLGYLLHEAEVVASRRFGEWSSTTLKIKSARRIVSDVMVYDCPQNAELCGSAAKSKGTQ